MKLQPFGVRIILKQHAEETKTQSGIILSGEPEKKFEGTIVACGEGAVKDNGDIRRMRVKVGDIVLFGEYAGQKFNFDGEDLLMMNEKDVIGIVIK